MQMQNKKLTKAQIKAIQWPKVQPHIQDIIINTVCSSVKSFGDNQYQTSKDIKMKLDSILKGYWVVIICPADQKSYNIHYSSAIVNGYEELTFTFQYMARRYLIFKCP